MKPFGADPSYHGRYDTQGGKRDLSDPSRKALALNFRSQVAEIQGGDLCRFALNIAGPLQTIPLGGRDEFTNS